MRLDKYSHVRTNMLMMDELPTSGQAYRILLQEETHLGLNAPEVNDTLACRVEKRRIQEKNGGKNNYESNGNKRQQLFCDVCKISAISESE